MTERDPIQHAADGAALTYDAHQAGQLEALRDSLNDVENLADALRLRIKAVESSRDAGFFDAPQGE